MISNNELKRDIEELCETIPNNFDMLVTLSKGGLIPSYYVAKSLNIKVIEILNINSYSNNQRGGIIDSTVFKKDFSNQNVLIIDDLVDSGKTLEYVIDNYKFKTYKILVHSYKTSSHIRPDYFCNKITDGEWIKYEYEQ